MQNKQKNWLIEALFGNRKILFLCLVFLIAFGVYSLSQMQRQGFPDVPVNVAMVLVTYPNANPEQVEAEILRPIEAAVKDLDSVDTFDTTGMDSFGIATITFDQNADVDDSVAELKTAIAGVTLPEGAQEPQVNKFSVSGSGEFTVAVSGFEDEWDLYRAGNVLTTRLLSVEGVAEVTALNELTPEMVLTFDTDALAETGVTRSQVEEAIRSAKFQAPLGSFLNDDGTVSISLSKKLDNIEDVTGLLIAENVQLSDVAQVEFLLNNNDKYNRIGYRDQMDQEIAVERALLYGVKIEKDADILNVEKALEEALAERTEEGKAGKALIVFSQADSTEQQISEITQSIFGAPIDSWGALSFVGYLFGGLAFVVILLLVFMNLRIAILAALSIPLSLFFAAIYLNFMGIGLNTLVLFSMVLTIGLVVDPTIVFLESMQRYREQGLSGKDAAQKTLQTVGVGMFLAVATNILVFVPFGVVGGFFGEIIKYIPATVIPAMVASMVIPVVFFTPFAASLLKSKNPSPNPDELEGTWAIGRWLGRSIMWLLGPGWPKAVLRVGVFITGSILPFAVGAALVGSGAVEVVQFAETDDADFIIVQGDVPDTLTFDEAVYEVVVPVQEKLKTYPEIKNFSYIGQDTNSFTLIVQLWPIKERADADMRTSDELSRAINDGMAVLNLDAEIEASTSGEGPPQDAFPVTVRVYESDTKTLEAAVADISNHLATIEGVSRIQDNSSQGSANGSVEFVLDGENQNAQNAFLVYASLQEMIGERELAEIELNGTVYEIHSKSDREIDSIEDVREIEVPTQEQIIYQQTLAQLRAQGVVNPEVVVPAPPITTLEDLVEEERALEAITINRTEGKRYAQISAAITEDVTALEIEEKLKEYLTAEKITELGLSSDAIDYAGAVDSIGESFTDLFIALAIAIFLIYLLLVGFFRSYFEPFIILFAIPLGLVGVFIAIAITTGQLGFLELLGVVAMAGIVVNVTILLLDFANQLKREGKSPAEAIATSVAVRFRPIVLTQLTAFGSLISLVFLSPFWKGLAASIIAGIIASALLSLFMTPLLYFWSNEWMRRVVNIKNRIQLRRTVAPVGQKRTLPKPRMPRFFTRKNKISNIE